MQMLNFAIAIVFLCLILSLFVSWAVEYYADKMNKKGILLKKMLFQLMGGNDSKEWTNKLYQHHLIKSLNAAENRLSSYIPPSLFAKVISDIIMDEKKSEETNTNYIEALKNGLSQVPDCNFKKNIELFISRCDNDSSKLDIMIEDWYNQYMIRVNHTYKRLLKTPLWLTSIVIALVLNIDAIKITSHIWNDTALQTSISIDATKFINNNKSLDSAASLDAFNNYKTSYEIPMGWNDEITYYKEQIVNKNNSKFKFFSLKILGIMITSMIASFGAPFWYDALRKIIGFKGTLTAQNQS